MFTAMPAGSLKIFPSCAGLKQHEDLARVAKDLILIHFHHIEADRLAQRPALAHSHNVTLLGFEAGRAVHGHVRMPLLEAVELLDVVKVVSPDDDGALHLRGHHHALQYFPSDAHVACEWALLVHVVAVLRLLGRREAKAD